MIEETNISNKEIVAKKEYEMTARRLGQKDI